MQLHWHATADCLGMSEIPLQPEQVLPTAAIDIPAVYGYRQARVRQEMARYNVAAMILSDPINIRYATGTRNMQVFSMRNAPARYLLLTADRCILFEFTGCQHLSQGYATVDEVRLATTASFVAAGPLITQREHGWAREMADLIHSLVGKGATVGLERLNAGAALALAKHDLLIMDAQQPLEMARAIKSTEEIKCIVASLRATETAVATLQAAIRPGVTEVALWSLLHQSVIAQNADYVETRLLSAGQRTNPWFQEAGQNVVEKNTLITLDTDVVGCYGYYADFSRTFHAGPEKPSAPQRTLYQLAYEQVHHNLGILHPGMTFRDYAQRAWNIPEKYYANRYYLSAHGVGMTGEYPYLYHHSGFSDFPYAGYDGVIKPGMTLCIESYIGEEGGIEGVKLEQQVLVTENGVQVLSEYPFEDALLR